MKYHLKRRWLSSVAGWRTLTAFWYDGRRYLTFSSTRDAYISRENLAAKITERYHAVEKGLSLPSPRAGFGKAAVPKLVRLVTVYVHSYGQDHVTRAAVGTLAAYRDFNVRAGLEELSLPGQPELGEVLSAFSANAPGISGVRCIRRDEIDAAVGPVGLDFFSSRHSTRVFDAAEVTKAEIELAVRAAMTAPAVCNREFSSVTVWTGRERIAEILALQGGARGFGEQVPAIAMVTVSLRAYWSEAERNQGWIDGGLFAMNFLLGLHAQGLGAVALNWSKAPHTDRRMRELVGLGDDRAIVMFVAFGHLREEYEVAASPRGPLEGFLSVDPN